MPKKTKFGFGKSSSVQSAIDNGVLNARDLLLLDEDTDKPKIGWISKDGKPVILKEEDEVVIVEGDALPNSGESGKIYVHGSDAYVWNGEKFVNLCKPTDVSALETEIATKVTAEEVKTMIKESDDSLVEIVEF